MDWEKIGMVLMTGFFLWFAYRRIGGKAGIKGILERSRNAPQHWGTYIFLMVMIILFVYLLIKL